MDQQFLESIASKLNTATEEMVEKTVSEMLNSDQWVAKIEKLATQRIVDKVSNKIKAIDVNLAIKDVVLENKQQIMNELADNFTTNGMADVADELQLTVMNGAVVIENELHTTDLVVETNTNLKGDVLINGNLAVKGRVNVDNASWQELAGHIGDKTYARVKQDFENNVINSIFDRAKSGFEFKDVLVDGKHLLVDDTLASGIRNSSLNTVGTLQNLSVQGRVGINTDTPSDALSIWDEEVSICAGKHSANTAYLGTSKNQNLIIGTNKQRQLEVNKEGGVWIDQLTVGKNRIGHSLSVPNYSGTKGDILFNISIKPDAPFAWICLGSYRWQELRSA